MEFGGNYSSIINLDEPELMVVISYSNSLNVAVKALFNHQTVPSLRLYVSILLCNLLGLLACKKQLACKL
ncbi:hypothetical protein P4645_22935, partial [Lysinibacillus fusiformis]|uniref:hypothetical protein n=1 Tax=Lysinibacillus fusiformis TaxID=28031 RepID=UPI002E22EC10|nr:hypothetical protein [Lysinibacillus fusiformis]